MRQGAAPALDAGLDLLERAAAGPLAYGVLLAAAPVSRATAARLVARLVERGYLERGADGYRLGPAAERLGGRPLHAALVASATPLLERLRDATGCSAILHAWDGRLLHCLAKAVHPEGLVMQEVGNAGDDLSSTPWGWSCLLDLPAADRPGRSAGGRFPGVLHLLPALADELDRHACCLDDQRVLAGVRRLGAPVRRRDGRLTATLGLGGTLAGLDARRLPGARRALAAAARDLARTLPETYP